MVTTENETDEDDEDVEIVEEIEAVHEQVVSVDVALPLKNVCVSSYYGTRIHPVTGKKSEHKGLDLDANFEDAFAMIPGEIVATGSNAIAGKFISILHGDITITYCHLSEICVKKGDQVQAGSKIGVTGDSGRTTGPHLHISCNIGEESVNPYPILSAITTLVKNKSNSLVK